MQLFVKQRCRFKVIRQPKSIPKNPKNPKMVRDGLFVKFPCFFFRDDELVGKWAKLLPRIGSQNNLKKCRRLCNAGAQFLWDSMVSPLFHAPTSAACRFEVSSAALRGKAGSGECEVLQPSHQPSLAGPPWRQSFELGSHGLG